MTTNSQLHSREDANSRSRRIAETHFESEASNDVDAIMRTMIDGDFMATAVLENPPEGRKLAICRTAEEQRAHYRTVRERINVTGADLFTSLGGSFYGLVHGIVYVDILATGEKRPNEALAVLPVSAEEDAIIGEIGGSRPVDAKRRASLDDPGLDRVANMRVLEEWIRSLGGGDADRMAGLHDASVTAAVRFPGERGLRILTGRTEVRSHYDELFGTFDIESVDQIVRVIDGWYAFAETAWTMLDAVGDRFRYRSANALIIGGDDQIVADLGYGTELERA